MYAKYALLLLILYFGGAFTHRRTFPIGRTRSRRSREGQKRRDGGRQSSFLRAPTLTERSWQCLFSAIHWWMTNNDALCIIVRHLWCTVCHCATIMLAVLCIEDACSQKGNVSLVYPPEGADTIPDWSILSGQAGPAGAAQVHRQGRYAHLDLEATVLHL